MTGRAASAAADAAADALIGRDKLAGNVLSGWTSQAVLIVSGFVTPRLIDARLGPELLGIWDFGWALTAWAALLPGGSATSINRYVAALRAVGDEAGINRAVSSISAVLALTAGLTLALGGLATWLLPWAFANQLGAHVSEARWVVSLLSAAIAVDIGLAGFGGVLSGFHRFDLFHGIEGVRNAVTTAAYIAALLLGGGVRELAAISLLGVLVGRLARAAAARRIFPPLELRWRHVNRATALEMVRFGGKSFLPQLGDLLLAQATTLVVMAALGPATVAVFARSRGLIRNARILVNRYAVVIIPTASALHAMGRREELQRQLIESTRMGLFLTLPFVLAFSILGGQLLLAWMGPGYEQVALLVWLSCGYLFVMAMQPALSVLAGMNAHGRAGLARVLAAIAAIGGVVVVLVAFDGGLTAVGVALAVPLVVVNGVYLPFYVCQRLGVALSQFVREAAVAPILCALPLAMSFAAARYWFADRAWLALATGLGGALLLGGPLYWRYAARDAVSSAFRGRWGFAPSTQPSPPTRGSGEERR